VMAAPTIPIHAEKNLGDPIESGENKAEIEGATLRTRVRSLEVFETGLHGIVKDEREARKRIERQLGLVQ
ncbi:hypothetical protein Tco_0323885, partial [Tanacetum coccineum]